MKDKKDMYTETIVWWDDLCPESYKVAIPAYGLKISKAKRLNDFSTEVTVKTPIADNLKEFLDDHEEGDYRELDVMSIACKTDDAYVAALKAKMSS